VKTAHVPITVFFKNRTASTCVKPPGRTRIIKSLLEAELKQEILFFLKLRMRRHKFAEIRIFFDNRFFKSATTFSLSSPDRITRPLQILALPLRFYQ